jgi:hypothetical protein
MENGSFCSCIGVLDFFFGFELVRDLSLKKFRFCRII